MVTAFLLILPSLLILFSAPTNALWKLKLFVSEFGFFLALPLLALSIFLLSGKSFFLIGLVGLLATAIYLLPLVKTLWSSRSFEFQLRQAYGKNQATKPFVFDFKRWFGLSKIKKVEVETVVYREMRNQKWSFDLYTDKQIINKKPCVICLHGGSWSSGDNQMFVRFNEELASLGYVVVDLNYRLAPEFIFPAQEEDVVSVLNLLEKNAERFSIDTNQLFLLGRSAGGQIAAVSAFHLGKERIKGLICFYTPHDMVWGYSFPGNPLILDSRKVLRDYLGGSFEEAEANFYAASPVHQVAGNSPPILMIHGKSDEMVAYEHNLRLIEKLKALQVPHFLLSFPYATHGCDYFSGSHSAQLSFYAVRYFLEHYSQAGENKNEKT
jgi:acetyl esterase/lipase